MGLFEKRQPKIENMNAFDPTMTVKEDVKEEVKDIVKEEVDMFNDDLDLQEQIKDML